MTNEEILKRFEFDLRMGRFKSVNNLKVKNVYAFRLARLSEFLLLSKILDKLGFTSNNFQPMHTNKGISIKVDDKIYWTYQIDLNEINDDENKLPEYCKRYKYD